MPARLRRLVAAFGVLAFLAFWVWGLIALRGLLPASAWIDFLFFAIGGTAPVELGALLTAMLSWHVVIGIGEAVITGLVVSAVLSVRPDLVHGAPQPVEPHLRADEAVAR